MYIVYNLWWSFPAYRLIGIHTLGLHNDTNRQTSNSIQSWDLILCSLLTIWWHLTHSIGWISNWNQHSFFISALYTAHIPALSTLHIPYSHTILCGFYRTKHLCLLFASSVIVWYPHFSHLFQIIPLQFQCPNTDHAASSNLAAGRLSIASSSIMIHYTFFSFIARLDKIVTRLAAQQ